MVNAAFIMPLENFLWVPVAPYLAVVTAVVLAALTQMPPIAALMMPLENFLWAPVAPYLAVVTAVVLAALTLRPFLLPPIVALVPAPGAICLRATTPKLTQWPSSPTATASEDKSGQ